MTQNVDLKELEKKAWKSTFEDGLWDFLFGMYFLGMAIGSLAPLYSRSLQLLFVPIWVMSIWNIGGFLLFFFGKKRITIPRIGFVKYGPKRKANRKKLVISMVILVSITVTLVILTISGIFRNLQLEEYTIMLLIGLSFVAVPFSLFAYFMKFNRLYIIAVMGGTSLFLGKLLNPFVGKPFGDVIVFVSFGSVIILTGVILFIRFLRKYPLLKEEVANDN